MKNKINFLISIFAILLVSSISTLASEKIKIGLLLPLSGENKNIGTSVLRSVSMAVNKIDSSKLEILPKNNFDNPEQNYIAAKELYDNGVRIFKFTNIGSEPLIINKVYSSCGCTIPKKPSSPIGPGQDEEIQVKYDTNRVGPIRKTITVLSNAINSPTISLKILGNVE